MKQGVLPFQYEQEKSSPGMTAMAGMMTYLELMHAAGLRSSVERHVGLRECGQGWTDSQVVSSLILLNLAGGESVVDLDVLEKDAGLCRVLREVESYGPTFPILGVFRLKGQPKRDGSIIVRSCKASQSPAYPIRDAVAVVEHPSCPSSSSSCPLPVG